MAVSVVHCGVGAAEQSWPLVCEPRSWEKVCVLSCVHVPLSFCLSPPDKLLVVVMCVEQLLNPKVQCSESVWRAGVPAEGSTLVTALPPLGWS